MPDWRIYAAGLRDDAQLVAEGGSKYEDTRHTCPGCWNTKRPERMGEDGYCVTCQEREGR